MRKTFPTLLSLVGVAVACSSPPCDAASLQADLDAAGSGQTVTVGACVLDGPLVVPAGVVLRGEGSAVLEGQGEDSSVTLREGAALERLEVRVDRGAAILVDGVGAARLEGVTLVGPISSESDANALPPMPGAGATATHGLVVRDAGTAEVPVILNDVSVRGFGRFGALFLNSRVRWEGGGAEGNVGVGVMARGGHTELVGLTIRSTYRGVSPFGHGLVLRDGAEVESEGLELSENQSLGALQHDARVTHTGLIASENREPGLWAQRGGRLSVMGSMLGANGLAGLVVIEMPAVEVRDSTLDDSRSVTRIINAAEVSVGDGIHGVLDDADALTLERVTLRGHPRVGLLLEIAAGSLDGATLDEVVVEADGEAYGAVAQSSSRVLETDAFGAGLERRGSASVNDALVPEPLGVLGVVAPMFLPPPEL